MPGTRITRQGEVRHCQGKVRASWTTAAAGGHPPSAGTNLFVLDCDGNIEEVWSSALPPFLP